MLLFTHTAADPHPSTRRRSQPRKGRKKRLDRRNADVDVDADPTNTAPRRSDEPRARNSLDRHPRGIPLANERSGSTERVRRVTPSILPSFHRRRAKRLDDGRTTGHRVVTAPRSPSDIASRNNKKIKRIASHRSTRSRRVARVAGRVDVPFGS